MNDRLSWVPTAIKGSLVPTASYNATTKILTASVTLPSSALSAIMPVLKLGAMTVPDLPVSLSAQSSAQLVP